MELFSPAFKSGDMLPQKYGRDFENINPPLSWSGLPEETQSLVLLMEDPDVPTSAGVLVWDHWVVFNIAPSLSHIPEAWQVSGRRGRGTRGELEYGGPKPPDREHRYFFKLLALNTVLDLPEGATKQDVLAASEGHVLDQAEVVGRFAPEGL
jgi:Raf kinase inhibitor-like YbhB/YbcL family protein